MELSQKDVEIANDFDNYHSFIPTWAYRVFVNLPHKTIYLGTGNQALKTASTAKHYVDRILGWHPIAIKNVVYWECSERAKIHRREIELDKLLETHKSKDSATWNVIQLPKDMKCPECGADVVLHKRGSRVFRFCSENLPGESVNVSKEGASAEVKNTQYPEFKKWLPKHLLKKDITSRNKSMIIKDLYGGPDIIIEFVSYNQPPQGTAGTQRLSCVAKGQRVLKSNGVWTNIEDINVGDELIYETMGGHGIRQRVNKVKKVIYNGKRKVYRFNCQKGISFEVTGDHLIMVPKKGLSEYKKAELLKVGDNVKCRISDIEGVDTLEKWKVALLGVVLGDGTLTDKSIKFTCKNDRFAENIKSLLPETLKLRKFDYPNHPDHSPDYFISKIGNGKNEFIEFIKELGLHGKVAGNKFVPDVIFKQSRKTIAYFLKYLFSTDGWASNHSIGYCSTSYRLSQDVYLLLRRLGIRSTIIERKFNNNWNTQWWVNISQSHDVLNFINKIGMVAKDEYIDKTKSEAKRRILSNLNKNPKMFNKDNPLGLNKSLPQNVKIKSIEYVGIKDVYDLTMEKGTKIKKKKRGKMVENMDYRSPKDNFLIQGGVVVHNCWLDEEPPQNFFEEQPPRLLAEDGDIVISCTPANRQSWLYDEVFEKACIYYRTQAVIDAYAKYCGKFGMKKIERTDSPFDIAVIQAATDDNPTLVPSVIEDMFKNIDAENHPDVIAIRRYGIFKQVSGRIFKSFNHGIHVISSERYFPHGVPKDWTHARGIDYHPTNPWACGVMSLSHQNELFVWGELNPSPEQMLTAEIADRLARMGHDYKFLISLIDPLATVIQVNTGYSTMDDLNRIFHGLYKEEKCKATSWQPWDTKSQVGRDEIKKRLKNSITVGKPFNNKVQRNGKDEYLPTIWILDYCTNFIKSLKNWRLEEWASSNANQSKDAKETPQQKWSHFCMVLEGILKHQAFKPRNPNWQPLRPVKQKMFQGRR